MFRFDHFNFNVLDLEKSLDFYRQAFGLSPIGSIEPKDGSFRIIYLGDGKTGFRLELTWLRDRTEPYNLGECEFHLALTAADFDAAHSRHAAMGCICYENSDMGIYFVTDPDGYWIEVVPEKQAD